ncbi:MAG: Ribulose-phosphate 3-epimerase [Candidatus Saccharibacteria bacterium]|nr:Ribulose-phosphate 3-epimerase [Candidatus Saccharibacteria bacterium]MDB5180264.1 Ribulose-phosphate 3-epimerase [Candidatus Saccharibacteria bacterium]
MAVVVPTIMVETVEQFKEASERVAPFARRIHIDISDGEFAPTFLLPESQLYWPSEWEIDIHAMVARPSEHLEQLIALKPSLIIIHSEVTENIVELIGQIKEAGIKAGLALLKTTVPATIADAIKIADHIMIFSGDLGKFGGTASMMQLEKVRLVQGINPQAEIGWDGGVNIENAYTLSQGGVDVLNTGGVIATAENPAVTYQTLVREINKHGVI